MARLGDAENQRRLLTARKSVAVNGNAIRRLPDSRYETLGSSVQSVAGSALDHRPHAGRIFGRICNRFPDHQDSDHTLGMRCVLRLIAAEQ